MNPYKPEAVKVIHYNRETEDCFTIRLDWKPKHDPGQFVQIGLPGIGECPISISSYSDKYLELNIREVGNVTRSLANLKVRDQVFVRGPYGRGYPMKDFTGTNIVIVGGGTGVAPLKGAVEYVRHFKNHYRDVSIFLGFRCPDELLFKDEIKECEACFDVTVSFDKIPAGCGCKGNEGFVTTYVEKADLSPENTTALICGPPIMIQKVAGILNSKGFRDEQIYTSMERLMYCGIGKCGHCMIHEKYTCKDGPVFRYDEVAGREHK